MADQSDRNCIAPARQGMTRKPYKSWQQGISLRGCRARWFPYSRQCGEWSQKDYLESLPVVRSCYRFTGDRSKGALSEPGTVTNVGCRCRTGRPRKEDEKEDSMRSRLLTGTKETAQAFRRWCERAENICIVTAWANDCMACECREKVRSKISTMAVAWISARPRLFPRIVPVSHVVSNI